MIGKGSFAQVFLSEHKATKKQFAVKIFTAESIFQHKSGLDSLLNEIEIMQCLNHQNILNLLEVYEQNKKIYLVLDLVSGGELYQKLKDKYTYKINDIKRLMQNILQAVEYIHQQKILHRDLTPKNILLKSKLNDYDIVIADFGLAQIQTTDIDEFLYIKCGTPGYVAPEILDYDKNKPIYNQKVDIFSLGIIFYQLLTGKHPFKTNDFKETVQRNRESKIDYERIELDNQQQTILAKDMVKSMTHKDPNQRMYAAKCLMHPFLQIDENTFSSSNNLITKNSEHTLILNSVNFNSQRRSSVGLNFARLSVDEGKQIVQKETSIINIKELVWISPAWNGNICSLNQIQNQLDVQDSAFLNRQRQKSNFGKEANKQQQQQQQQYLEINLLQQQDIIVQQEVINNNNNSKIKNYCNHLDVPQLFINDVQNKQFRIINEESKEQIDQSTKRIITSEAFFVNDELCSNHKINVLPQLHPFKNPFQMYK